MSDRPLKMAMPETSEDRRISVGSRVLCRAKGVQPTPNISYIGEVTHIGRNGLVYVKFESLCWMDFWQGYVCEYAFIPSLIQKLDTQKMINDRLNLNAGYLPDHLNKEVQAHTKLKLHYISELTPYIIERSYIA